MTSAASRPLLLIQTAFIGDVILMTALLEHLHRTAPTTVVDVLVRRGNEGLLRGHPYVRNVLVWDKSRRKYPNLLALLRQIRRADYGQVVTLQRFASTGMLTALSGAPVRVGFAKNPWAPGFTRKVPHVIGDGTHEVQRNLRLLTAEDPSERNSTLNTQHSTLPSALPRLYPTAADEAAAAPYTAAGSYLCIAPTSVWFTKQFPEEKWAELLQVLPARYRVYLLGAPADAPACERLRQASGRPEQVVNLAGQISLLASAVLMRGAVLTYVNDSAPMHLCSAVGAPVCAVFCSTVPAFGFSPLSPFSRVVEHPGPLACRPCGLHGHGACPLGHFKCALDIEIQQLLKVLAEAEASAANN